MIKLGLRLTFNGGREAVSRLVIIALAVMVGVAMLLATVAGINAVNAQNARYAWLATGAVSSASHASADPLWGMLSSDYFDGQIITRADLAPTGPTSPVPPGIGHLPGPGQFYASPAMSRLLAATPAAELGARYPGTADRHDRRGGVAGAGLTDHHRRSRSEPALARARSGRGAQHQHETAQRLWRLCDRGRYQLQRHRPHPRRGRASRCCSPCSSS